MVLFRVTGNDTSPESYRHSVQSPFHSRSRVIRFVVLVSGSGSNLQALIDRRDPSVDIVGVVSDRVEAPALERARVAGIADRWVPWGSDRLEATRRLVSVVQDLGAQAVVLAGFMRVLSADAIAAFPWRIVNVHPSLLPAFPGANAVADALAAGVVVTGVTVHFVDEIVDHGPIIRQVPVAIDPGDDVASLHAKIQKVEHVVLPEVVGDLAAGRVSVVEGRVVWIESR